MPYVEMHNQAETRGFYMSDPTQEKPEPVCPKCNGTGSIPIIQIGSSLGPPKAQMCDCHLKKAILRNVERGMPKLSKWPSIPSSVLLGREKENLWITAPREWVLPNLRHVALRHGPTWGFYVTTDAELMVAWLANVSLTGGNIMDAETRLDAASVSLKKLTLVDLIEPPELLVIRLGVKASRNSAMNEVFLETLQTREHLGKPTWIWDTHETMLAVGHMCHSYQAEEFLEDWPRIDSKLVGANQAPAPNRGNGRVNLAAPEMVTSTAPVGRAPTAPTVTAGGFNVRNMMMGPGGTGK